MYCTKCGKKISDEAMFCPFCGNPVHEILVKPEEPETPVSVDEPVTRETPVSGKTVAISGKNYDLVQILEFGAAIVGFLLLLPLAVRAISNALNILHLWRYLYSPVNAGYKLLRWVIRIFALAEAGGLTWLIVTNTYKDKIVPGIAAALSLFVFLATFLTGHRTLFALMAIAALVVGFDLFMKVCIHRTGLTGMPDLQGDINYIREVYKKSEKVEPEQYTDVNIPKYEETPEIDTLDSYFDGTGVQCLGYILAIVLITVFTCTLGLPFILVKYEKWHRSHMVIEGRRLSFNGTGLQLFGLWLKWFLLCIITCGIYGFFAYVDMQKWLTRHTTYEGREMPEGNEYMASYFDGNSFEYLGYGVLTSILCGFTCGLAFPWCATMIQKWQNKSTVIDSDRLFYDGTGGGLLGTWLVCLLLTIITCGIYSPWATVRLQKYIVNHIHVDATYRGVRVR